MTDGKAINPAIGALPDFEEDPCSWVALLTEGKTLSQGTRHLVRRGTFPLAGGLGEVPSVSKAFEGAPAGQSRHHPHIDEVLEEYPFDHSLSTFLAT